MKKLSYIFTIPASILFWIAEKIRGEPIAWRYEEVIKKTEFTCKECGHKGYGCPEEQEPTYYSTIIKSDIWHEWTKHQEKVMEWDVWESIECNLLSEGHWKAFCEWSKKVSGDK